MEDKGLGTKWDGSKDFNPRPPSDPSLFDRDEETSDRDEETSDRDEETAKAEQDFRDSLVASMSGYQMPPKRHPVSPYDSSKNPMKRTYEFSDGTKVEFIGHF